MKKERKESLLNLHGHVYDSEGNNMSNATEYISEKEIARRNIFPKGKKIRKVTAFDARYENYWGGTHPPELTELPASRPQLYWYDLARDKVMGFSYATQKWENLPKTSIVPKFAFELTENGEMRHCGVVEDGDEVTETLDLSTMLEKELEL